MQLACAPGAQIFAVYMTSYVGKVEPRLDHPIYILKLTC